MQTKTNNMLTTPKKHIKFAVLAFTFFVLFSGNCIGQSITWQRTYDGPAHYNDRAYSLSQADGSNFYVVGRTIVSGYYHYILKLN